MVRIAVELPKIAKFVNIMVPTIGILFLAAGIFLHTYFHIGTAIFAFLTVVNFYYRHVQVKYAILRNFGMMGQMRYMFESVGPEFRQYLFMSDTEEKPFNREEREEVYAKSKNEDSTSSFGSQKAFGSKEVKIRHSMYPADKLKPYRVTFGEERGIKNTHTLTKHMMISAMSYGALGENAVRALARGAKRAGITMNTGEGGYPKYHLMEGCDLVFQMGTAKFGVRNEDGTLNDDKLRALAKKPQIKMIEIKFSQGAKPGKGGLLPKEKITEEIAELRGVPMGKDVISPAHHKECTSPKTTVEFIKHVQDVSELPVGIKMCIGHKHEFIDLVHEMKKQRIFPDYIAIDGSQGGTGAAPKSFMDDVGMPLFPALEFVQSVLEKERVRNKLKITASGKLINPGKQITAMSLGADVVYTARGFMLALGCIQALQCNRNTCPVGITTHVPSLQKGLDIEEKAKRVANYVNNSEHEFEELLTSSGVDEVKKLSKDNLYIPGGLNQIKA